MFTTSAIIGRTTSVWKPCSGRARRPVSALVDGARDCPPEDCGGSAGYADLLEVLLDPKREEFEHMRQWAGPRFNTEAFSVNATS